MAVRSDELTIDQVRHFWRLVDEGLVTRVNFQAYLEQPNKFAETLVNPALPTEITVAGVTYEILSFLREGETSVRGNVMVDRAVAMRAHQGKEDCDHLLAHQDEIPAILRGKIVFVFTDMRRPVGRGLVACVRWGGGGWCLHWHWLDVGWHDGGRVLRRK